MNYSPVVLQTCNVSYAVNHTIIVSDINLLFYGNRIYSIVGPNGSGKSTLIRLLCLLVRPTAGKILVQREDSTAMWPNVLHLRRRLALVAQTPTMFKASVYDNVAVGLRFRGFSKKEVRRKVEEALSFVSMEHLRRRYAPTLSLGEAQMVALARAIVLEPKTLLLDEPASNLDPRNTRSLEEHLQRLVKKQKTTVIMVTHSLKQAERLAHEAVFLYRGRVVEVGEAQSFFGDPRDEQTRKFLKGELLV